MDLENLHHSSRNLPTGGKVIVLNTGALITPEAEAMLQALHSRSTGGLSSHLKKLQEKGPTNFMQNFYVGYGHKSIGDCGTTTLFIEGVSMLVAKAIQDWPLYSGQESSTRYIDFSQQPFNPVGSQESTNILERWRSFYLAAGEPLREHLRLRFPHKPGEDEKIYEKAISARAFDILRSFLPAGATTNIAWHTNLRQAADKLVFLRHHPLPEVREIAQAIESALQEAHPSSFGHKQYDATESYTDAWMTSGYYLTDQSCPDFSLTYDAVNRETLSSYRAFLENRPPKTELPKQIAECGMLQFQFLLDYGSFRDLQRHRAVSQRMPLLTSGHGFEEWYLTELPVVLRADATVLLTEQLENIKKLSLSKEVQQYYLPMGFRVPVRLTGDLSSLVYLVELRGTRFVHPTLAARAIQMANVLREKFTDSGLRLHMDMEPGRFDIKRGTHDIVEK